MSKYYKKSGSDPIANIFIAIVNAMVLLFKWLWGLIFGKKQGKFDKIENQKKWHDIENMIESGDEIHAQQAVIRADKYFDSIMIEAGARGGKFADRLRSLEPRFGHETYQSIWDAHKLRNQISHEVEHRSSVTDCKIALSKFHRGLQGLGAI